MVYLLAVLLAAVSAEAAEFKPLPRKLAGLELGSHINRANVDSLKCPPNKKSKSFESVACRSTENGSLWEITGNYSEDVISTTRPSILAAAREKEYGPISGMEKGANCCAVCGELIKIGNVACFVWEDTAVRMTLTILAQRDGSTGGAFLSIASKPLKRKAIQEAAGERERSAQGLQDKVQASMKDE